jgi:hypothetical protein
MLLREAQNNGDLAMFSKNQAERQSMMVTLRRPMDAVTENRGQRIAQLLELDTGVREFVVVYGVRPQSRSEIAIQSRSMMQVLVDFGSYIDVPARDIAEGRVYSPTRDAESDRLFPSLLRVKSGEKPPPDAHLAVRYRDGWFWIEDRDHESKAAFNFLMMLFSLTETGNTQAPPIVTVPAR